MSEMPWPDLREEDRWLIPAIEQRLRDSNQRPEEMRKRALELRAEAQRSGIGVREAKLALAAHYEQAATSRLAA